MAQQVEILSLNIDTNALITKLSATKKAIEELQASQRNLQQAGESSSQQYIEQAALIKNLQRQYNGQHNVLTQLNAANKDAASATDAVNSALGKNITSIAEATENSRQLTIVRNQLNLSTQEGRDALDAINKKLNENTEFIRENVSAQEQQRMNIGNYSDSIKEALGNLNPFNGGIAGFTQRSQAAGGAGNLLRQSFSQLATGIGGATKAALGFIATPIGAAIAAVTAAFAAGKAIFDYNSGLQAANKELKALGLNAGDLSKVRNEITATADTFDKDFKDIASKANSLAKSYGISMSEANDIIAQGLASGGAQNEEFLDSLGEYDQLFANAGYSAQEFVNIVNQGYELGIYADKLPDAIKEADLALKEQGKATRDALVNAFGGSFTDEILQKVRTGELTTSEALNNIAKKASETQLTQQQQAQLTADVFKGAGEDAGGAMAVLTAINQSANKELDATAKKQLELVDANERLNEAQSELFEIKGFGDVWTSVKVMATDALAAMMEHIAGVKKDIQPLLDFVGVVLVNAWQQLKTTVTVVFNIIKGGFAVIGNTIGTFFNFFKALVTGDFSGAINALKNGFNNLLSIVGNTFGRIKNNIIDGLKGIVSNVQPILSALGVDVEKLQKKLDGLKSKNIDVKATSVSSENTTTTSTSKNIVADVDPNAAANAKAAADAQKKATEEKMKLLDAEMQKQTEAINLFIAQQGVKKKALADELAFEEQLMNKRLALLEIERKGGKKSQTAYETEKLNITNSFAKKQAEVAVQLAADELAQKKKVLEQQKQDETFFTEEKLMNAFKLNNNMAMAERDYQLARKEAGLISEQEYLEAVDAINEANRIKNEEAQALRDEAKKEQKAIDLENQMILDEEKFTNDFDRQLAEEEIRYQAELKAAEKTGADTTKIKEKHANIQKKIEQAKEAAIRQGYADTFGQAAQLLGEKTLAGKAAAIAESTINTYQGVTAVLSSKSVLPEPMGTIAKVVSTGVVLANGLAAVKKISGVKLEQGGLVSIGGKRHSQGGTKFFGEDGTNFEAERGELIGVMNRNAAKHFMAFNNSFPAGRTSSGYFEGGGIVGGFSQLTNLSSAAKIDYDILASKIGQEVGKANLALPSPTVQVDTITEAQSSNARIVAGAAL